MTGPALPFTQVGLVYDPKTPITGTSGYRDTLEGWHRRLILARQALIQNPNDAGARQAAQDSHLAIQSYANDLSRSNAYQRRLESGQANEIPTGNVVAANALDAASLGLPHLLPSSVNALERMQEQSPTASAVGQGLGGVGLGILTGFAVPPAAFGATPAMRGAAALRSAGVFGAEGGIRGFVTADHGTLGERLERAQREAGVDALLGGIASEMAAGANARHLRPIVQDEALAARAAEIQNRALTSDLRLDAAVAQRAAGVDPAIAAQQGLRTQILTEQLAQMQARGASAAEQAPLRQAILEESAQQAPMRTELLRRRVEGGGATDAVSEVGSAAGVTGLGTEAGTGGMSEATIRAALTRQGFAPDAIERALDARRAVASGVQPAASEAATAPPRTVSGTAGATTVTESAPRSPSAAWLAKRNAMNGISVPSEPVNMDQVLAEGQQLRAQAASQPAPTGPLNVPGMLQPQGPDLVNALRPLGRLVSSAPTGQTQAQVRAVLEALPVTSRAAALNHLEQAAAFGTIHPAWLTFLRSVLAP